MYSFIRDVDFFAGNNVETLIEKFGSPLYVYNENILRDRCKQMANLVKKVDFKANYSTKANSNISLLKIIKDEGLNADAMSPGEIYALKKAGFKKEQIFYVSNNVSIDEMKYAVQEGILTSVDSISQLEQYAKLNPGGNVCVRFNPGIGAGHHQKVITGGKKTKFGVSPEFIPDVKEILKKYKLKMVGVNQHIGSLFMKGDAFIEGVKSILNIAKNFDDLEFIDLGGGFGIPYKRADGEKRLNLDALRNELEDVLLDWLKDYKGDVCFKTEPGRYVTAECGLILTRVNSIKDNYESKYIGTDLGFNLLARPVMYDSYHEIEIFRNGELVQEGQMQTVNVVGNICETGDVLARDRNLLKIEPNDCLAVLDAGAYGFCMSSNYNNRTRPAEVLITSKGEIRLIRRRENLDDLFLTQIVT